VALPSVARGVTAARRLDAVVRGRVQGVGYRFFVLRLANDLGLDGWVSNEADGSVRVRAEGPTNTLGALLDGLRVGPSGARVDDVDVRWGAATRDLGPFAVRSRAHPGD
jgi:acylphosphatase